MQSIYPESKEVYANIKSKRNLYCHARLDLASRKMKTYYIYMMASKKNGTLYTGMTSDLIKRIYEHKNNLVEGFTKKYNVHTLVWYEETNNVEAAIKREKNIQSWKRAWKLEMIEKNNPLWKDLYDEITGCQLEAGMTL